MKLLLKCILLFVIIEIGLYGLGSLTQWNVHFSKWADITQILFNVLTAFSVGFCAIYYGFLRNSRRLGR